MIAVPRSGWSKIKVINAPATSKWGKKPLEKMGIWGPFLAME